MKLPVRLAFIAAMALSLITPVVAQNKAGVLTPAELKKVVPSAYFFRGQSASVQLRNAVGFRDSSDRYVLAALVDTSGYSTDIQEKYQGLFITDVKLKVGDAFLAPKSRGSSSSRPRSRRLRLRFQGQQVHDPRCLFERNPERPVQDRRLGRPSRAS